MIDKIQIGESEYSIEESYNVYKITTDSDLTEEGYSFSTELVTELLNKLAAGEKVKVIIINGTEEEIMPGVARDGIVTITFDRWDYTKENMEGNVFESAYASISDTSNSLWSGTLSLQNSTYSAHLSKYPDWQNPGSTIIEGSVNKHTNRLDSPQFSMYNIDLVKSYNDSKGYFSSVSDSFRGCNFHLGMFSQRLPRSEQFTGFSLTTMQLAFNVTNGNEFRLYYDGTESNFVSLGQGTQLFWLYQGDVVIVAAASNVLQRVASRYYVFVCNQDTSTSSTKANELTYTKYEINLSDVKSTTFWNNIMKILTQSI